MRLLHLRRWLGHCYYIGTPLAKRPEPKTRAQVIYQAARMLENPLYYQFSMVQIKNLCTVEIDGHRYSVLNKQIEVSGTSIRSATNYCIQTMMFGVEMEFDLNVLLDMGVVIEATSYDI